MSTGFRQSIDDYINYHEQSQDAGDIDPSYSMLRYLCKRFELNTEQRYWLAFLYATCYCGPTVFYIYNEFPDYENVDYGRLRWWWEKNKQKCLFQTDRLRVKTQNLFCETFLSYKKLVGENQEKKFNEFKSQSPESSYRKAFREMSQIKNFGQFSMFLYLEAVKVVTGFAMEPDFLDLSKAESCRNGLCFALGKNELMNHFDKKQPSKAQLIYLQEAFSFLCSAIKKRRPEKASVWNIETTLCAFKKHKLGKRWIGYYIERQKEEILKMQKNVNEGVDWSVLWQYRKETFNGKFLSEDLSSSW